MKNSEEEKKSEQVSDYFSENDLRRISDAIEEAEKNTSGEIRVKIMMHFDDDLMMHRDSERAHYQAVREFEKEGLVNTRDKTGILLLIVMAERKFQILADEGINQKVKQGYWNIVAWNLVAHFKKGQYVFGICSVVKMIGFQLANFFPIQSDDIDELPNEVIVED